MPKTTADMTDIKKHINAAATKEELQDISYDVFKAHHFDTKLADKVIQLCIQREVELGLL